MANLSLHGPGMTLHRLLASSWLQMQLCTVIELIICKGSFNRLGMLVMVAGTAHRDAQLPVITGYCILPLPLHCVGSVSAHHSRFAVSQALQSLHLPLGL